MVARVILFLSKQQETAKPYSRINRHEFFQHLKEF